MKELVAVEEYEQAAQIQAEIDEIQGIHSDLFKKQAGMTVLME